MVLIIMMMLMWVNLYILTGKEIWNHHDVLEDYKSRESETDVGEVIHEQLYSVSKDT